MLRMKKLQRLDARLLGRAGSTILTRLALCGLTLLSAMASADQALTLKGPRPVVWSNFLGLNAQFEWVPEANYRGQITRLKELGLKWTRNGIHWDRFEPNQGQYQTAALDRLVTVMKEQNLASTFYLVGSAPFATTAPAEVSNKDQYPPRSAEEFGERMHLLATRYPSVAAWQVWNEQNIPPYWQPTEDPVGYQALLEAAAPKIKSANPKASVVIGGMAYYSQMPIRGGLMLEALLNQGALAPDRVVAYHPYSQEPEGDVAAERDFLLYANRLNSSLRAHGVKSIWATEFGWSSYAGPVELQPIIGELGQAEFTLRRLALMAAMDFDRVFLFSLSDLDARATARDRSYGLLRENGQPKPAFFALQRFLQATGKSITPIDPPNVDNAPAGMISVAWRRTDGKMVWMFWANQDGRMALPATVNGYLRDPVSGAAATLKPSAGTLSVPVKKTLQLLIL